MIYFLFLLKLATIRNNISYLAFRNALLPYKVFSVKDAKKAFPAFDSKRLVEWQQKGYIKKLINKWYLFADIPVSESLLYRISNCLLQPSYVSLQSALSYYNLIPEAVFNISAVSTRKTISYQTPAGQFSYRTIKPEYFFGYNIIRQEGLPVLFAEVEKALIDTLYFNANLNTAEDLHALRLNTLELRTLTDWEKLYKYAAVYNSLTLDRRIKLLKKFY